MSNQIFTKSITNLKILILTLLGLSPVVSVGQFTQVDSAVMKGMTIRSIGPAGMSGRVTAIDVNLRNPLEIFVGTASGGVWKSKDGGHIWKPVFDDQPVQSIGAIAINQRNPSEIWVGTGEGNPRNSHNSGAGVFKSIDGGITWTMVGLEKSRTIHRIIVNSDNPDIVYIGAMGSIWGPNEDRGVFKTTDGGITWKKVLYVNDKTGVGDMVVDPSNPNKLLVNMWEYGRRPWDFKSGGEGSGLYLTFDGGKNWTRLSEKDGLPQGELGRAGLAFAPSRSSVVYALIEAKQSGFYRSTDGGLTWELRATDNIGNRPFYYYDIFVDPKNENRIFNLFSRMSKSEDGGKTFENFGSNIHPDHHAFWIYPDDPQYMIEGNDGGVNISRDGGESWRFVDNIPVAQFYHIDYDMDIPYNVYGGLQDNGSWVGPSEVWKSGGITNHDWQELYFGDGFDVLPRRDNSRFGYAMSQGGNVGYYDRLTGKTVFIQPVHPEGIDLRFNWNAAIAGDPFNTEGVYYGSQFVHKSSDCGQSWEIISPDLTTNDTSKQKQHLSGGLTIDATGAENHTTILAISPSSINQNEIWVGTDDGNVQVTLDGGANWNNVINNCRDCPRHAWIPQIVPSGSIPGQAFVILNNYRMNDYKPYAFLVSDYGRNWKRIADESQIAGFTLAIVQDPVEPNLLFLGTDFGLYVSFDMGTNWKKWTDFPSTSVMDLKIHPREHDLILGTFGRAVHIMDDITPLRELAKNPQLLDRQFIVFSAADAYQANSRSYQGIRFTADATFEGENSSSNAAFTVWVKSTERPQAGEVASAGSGPAGRFQGPPGGGQGLQGGRRFGSGGGQANRVRISVYDESDKLMRNFSSNVEQGFNRISWQMNRNGVRMPGFGRFGGGGGGFGGGGQGRNADPPGGASVLPGKYKLVFEFRRWKDSTTVMVHQDPRLEVPISELKEQEAFILSYYDLVERVTEAYEFLTESKETVESINNAMANQPEDIKKKTEEWGKQITEKIDEVSGLFTVPRAERDGKSRLLDLMRTPMRYMNSLLGAPGENVKNAVRNAERMADEVLPKVNELMEGAWVEYRMNIEGVEMKFFKDAKPIRVN